MTKAVTAVVIMMVLTACGGGQGLRSARELGTGPDAFAVLPTKALQMPGTSDLPAPTPGARNLVDQTPNADAIAALGGRPDAAFAGGIPAADGALVAAVSRHGVPGDIRAVTAREDAARRGRGGWGLFRLFGGDRYFGTYSGQRLDAYGELTRLRALGVETPSAPPQ